ncbi:MAG: glycoside hydrolase family 13 protein [Ruminococcaceae bacterium]|nr:glycoside hydrolase family 13 protein [Oscillospiraceae bacterium]
MEFLFDSRSKHFKIPFGCIKSGETLTITVYVKDAGETGVLFKLFEDGKEPICHEMKQQEQKNGYNVYTCSVVFEKTGLFFYYFTLSACEGFINIFRDEKNRPVLHHGSSWQITCYAPSYSLHKEWLGRVMYQIFPDRFNKQGDCDTSDKLTPFYLHESPDELPVYEPDETGIIQNNDFFGGNLQGIIEKLPYLKNLGVGTIYLNPVFKAFSNHRYDTADYLQVDPLLGTNDDFRRLCESAHNLNIKVILDGVFSHTGSDSLYFDIHNRFGMGAYHNPDSPYRSWYQFHDYPHHYATWWGISTLPCTDEMNPDFCNFIFGKVTPYWLSLGADGWRLDVADELPEAFLEKLYSTVKQKNPEAIVLGEVWEDASNKISYGVRRRYLQGKSLDSVMNYVWRDAIIRFARGEASAEDLQEAVMTLCEHYPPDSLHTAMNLLSTHDTPRILTTLGIDFVPESKKDRAIFRLTDAQRTLGKNRLFLAAFLAFCLPGSPCIYYGDEIGLEAFEDPFNRGYMGSITGDDEITACFRSLADMKNQSPALRFGDLIPLFAENGLFAFYRIEGTEKILCLVNNNDKPRHFHADGEILFGKNYTQKDNELILFQYGCAAIAVTRQ